MRLLRDALAGHVVPEGGILSISLPADEFVRGEPTPIPRTGYCLSQPLQGEFMTGTGVAVRFLGRGPKRFEDLAGRFNQLTESWETFCIGTEAVAPVAFTGFCFDKDEEPGSRWLGLPNAMIVVPSVLYRRHRGQAVLTFSAGLAACPTRAMTPAQQVDAWMGELDSLIADSSDKVNDPAPLQLARSEREDGWKARLEKALSAIRGGQVDKLVMTREARFCSSRPVDCARVFRALEAGHPECTQFAVCQQGGSLLGVSPERLISVRGNDVLSDALAGTTPRGRDPEEDDLLATRLLDDEKTREEHRIVVDQVINSLVPACTTLEAPGAPNLMRLPRIQHLWSPVRGRRRVGVGVLDLAAALHPTPAVGGSPRAEALGWLLNQNESRRGWYTGAFGWLDAAGDGELSVVLRCGVINGTQVDLYAGAGIVADSDPDQELAETEWKLLTMQGALKVG